MNFGRMSAPPAMMTAVWAAVAGPLPHPALPQVVAAAVATLEDVVRASPSVAMDHHFTEPNDDITRQRGET